MAPGMRKAIYVELPLSGVGEERTFIGAPLGLEVPVSLGRLV